MKISYDPLRCPSHIFTPRYHGYAKVIEKLFKGIDIKDCIKKKDDKKKKLSE